MSSTRLPALTLVLVLSVLWPAAVARAQGCPTCAAAQAASPTDAPTAASAPGDNCTTCAGKCKSEHCCPKYVFTQEKMPTIKYCRVCSKPLAEPCSVASDPGYGYYPTCWRPMGPLNYTHCTVPPPAILAQPPPKKGTTESTPERQPEEAAPPPNRVGLLVTPRP
jgi:hypothetical protein